MMVERPDVLFLNIMPGLNVTQEDIDQFVAITQSSQEDAQRFLSSGTTLGGALEDYFAAQAAAGAPSGDIEEEIITDDEVMSEQDQPAEKKPRVGGPTTLDGRPVDDTLPEGWGQPQNSGRRAPGGFGGVADLFSSGLHGSASRGQPQQNSDDDDEDEDDEKGQEFFTGGEKSGLAVQNPDRPGQRGARGIVDKILEQAKSNGPSKSPEPSGSGHHFGGSGNVLGSEDTPSDAAPPAAAPASAPSPAAAPSGAMEALMGMLRGSAQPPQDDDNEVQTRRLTFWRNGFSIEDGPLLSYDEPRNRETLEAIQSGRAPPSLFGVRFNQPLQVEVAQRKSEDYQPPPKRPAKPFEGSGNRLGAATPQVVSGSSTPSMPGSLPAEAAAAPAAPPSFAVDQSQPTTSIQVRLGDGTRLVAKVNLTHTVEDLRNFVAAARPDQRPFVLQTTFPSKELSDHKETIEGAKLQNAVVVQRFT